MKRRARLWGTVPGMLLLLSSATSQARELTFEDRVKAQEAIERVYYSHQIGATQPFESVVTRAVLEKKVRDYLEKSQALEQVWGIRIRESDLRAEVARIDRHSRMPDRWKQLSAALRDDPLWTEECLARPVLVERLARRFFAQDQFIHREARRAAETLHDRLLTGETASDLATTAPVMPESCGQDDSWSNGSLDQLPAPRWNHVAVWTGSVMIIWGGNLTDALTGGRYDPATDSWSSIATSGAPTGNIPTMVWTGSVVIVWGGDGTTGARYDPLTDTWNATSTLNAPQARFGHTAVWTGSRMLVWGGYGVSPPSGTVATGASYDPVSDVWTPMPPAPDARFRHTAVWTGSEMIVWGGFHFSGDLNLSSGLRYNPIAQSWASTSLVGAPPLGSNNSTAMAVWTGSRMIAQRGSGGGLYDPATDSWTPVTAVNAPTAYQYTTAVWTGTEMIVWGGQGPESRPRLMNAGSRYDPASDTWRSTSFTNAPSPREGHTAVWTGQIMIVWGGFTDSGFTSTGGRYDPASDSWTPTGTEGPVPRTDHTAVWTGNLVLVWGGIDENLYPYFYPARGERYDPVLDAWTPMSLAGAPYGRSGHSAVWTGDSMIVWGGTPNYVEGYGGRYDPITDHWFAVSTYNTPSSRTGQSAVWTGREMIVWGGANGSELATGGRYDPTLDLWRPTSAAGAPLPRQLHSAVWTGSRMVVWGGLGQAQPGGSATNLNTGAQYDPVADTWSTTPTTGAPSARRLQTAVWTGRAMIVWGGTTGGTGFLASGGEYDPAANVWTPVSLGGPSARQGHSAIWTGSAMIVWGGRNGTSAFSALATGGRYDATAHSWTPTSSVNRPFGRYEHASVWTGQEMIVWGGYAGGIAGGGGRYCSVPSCSVSTFYSDADSDGFGSASDTVLACQNPPGYVTTAGDCDDAHAQAHPGAQEICDGLDNDCNGVVDDGFAPPAGAPSLGVSASGATTVLDWVSWSGATGYDVVKGSLWALQWNGDFMIATTDCLADDVAATSVQDTASPAAGAGFWYLVRPRYCGGVGSYDSGSSHQSGSRDNEIRDSGHACP